MVRSNCDFPGQLILWENITFMEINGTNKWHLSKFLSCNIVFTVNKSEMQHAFAL